MGAAGDELADLPALFSAGDALGEGAIPCICEASIPGIVAGWAEGVPAAGLLMSIPGILDMS